MDNSPATTNPRPRRRSTKFLAGPVQEVIHSDSSSASSTYGGRKSATKRLAKGKETSAKKPNVLKNGSASGMMGTSDNSHGLQSPPPLSGTEANLSDAEVIDVSSPKHTYISDLDDLSDLTPLPSDVDQDTRPSTPDHVIHNSEASSSAPHCRPYASPVKKRKLNGGNNYFPISSKHAQSPSLKGKQSVPDPDSDSELPAYYAVWSSQQTAPPSQDDAETISRQPERKAKSKGKRKKRTSVASEKEPAQEDDEFERSLLQIPGELIYAKAMPKGEYWPALIEEYIKDGEDKGQYRIIWMDDSKQNIPRSWFYTSQDEEFITCKLGKFESVYEEDDDEGDDEPLEFQRSPSPEPSDPPPSKEDFCELSIRHQFVYTKRVLKAILDKTYEPALHRHQKFMKGGRHRRDMGHKSSLKGLMDPKEVRQIHGHLVEWVLRDEKLGAAKLDGVIKENEHEIIDLDGPLSMQSPPVGDPSAAPAASENDYGTIVPPSSNATSSAIENDTLSDGGLAPPSSLATTPIFDMETSAISNGTSDLTSNEGLSKQDVLMQPVRSSSRQRGCEDFESMSSVSKVDYCISVLLPEAVRQILLWRSGERRSVDLLSPEEERDLYSKGEQLLAKRDWVHDITRLRRILTEQNEKKLKAAMRQKSGSTSTRSRRVMRLVNYTEDKEEE